MIVERGLAESREKAQALIMAGVVYVAGERVEKPGQRVRVDQDILITERMPYVSRGGLKLEGALEAFSVSVEQRVAADLGVSTGGFTDCLLQRAARKVYAVDVDTRQVDWRLRKDPRVVLIEKNARYLTREDFDESPEVVTVDLSFISVLKVLPAVRMFLEDGDVVALIKPQFEAGRRRVGKKGVVKDPSVHQDVLERVIEQAEKLGFRMRGLVRSPIRGQKGNREFFLLWSLKGPSLPLEKREQSLKEAVWNEKDG
ncbi:MAG: TlyA family RNA methyltransferase [Candidatus Aminicenantales bacterium]